MNWAVEIERRIRTCVIIVLLLVVLGFFAETFWLFDLFTHFRIQYVVCFFIAAIVLFFLKSKRWAAISGVFGFVLAVWTAPHWVPYAARSSAGEFTLLAYNIRTSNQQYENVISYIRDSESDLALILEINHEWEKRLNELSDIYPYKISHSREDNFGILLLSRRKIKTGQVVSFPAINLPSVVAEIEMSPEHSLYLVGTHPIPPYGGDQSAARNQQLREIAEFCQSKSQQHVVVAGDLNVTPFSPVFTKFVDEAGLVDSGTGWGWQPTWFSHMPWFAIPIDHILFSDTVVVTDRITGPTMGSDHNPLIVKFSFTP